MIDQSTIRCGHCRLNQFLADAGKCRRCKQPFQPLEVQAIALVVEIPAPPEPPPNLAVTIGLRIHDHRKRSNLSQRELAEKFGIARTYISKCEQGKCLPTIESLEKYVSIFGCSLFAFLSDKDEEDFIMSIAPHVHHLSPEERRAVLNAASICAKLTKEDKSDVRPLGVIL